MLGGLCAIAATLNEKREVVQLPPMQSLSFGERDGKLSDRVKAIAEAFASGNSAPPPARTSCRTCGRSGCSCLRSPRRTCLMRTSVGNILAAPGGRDFLLGMLDEISAIATASGYTPGGPFFERTSGILTTEGSPMTASMFRDIKAGLPVEADHVIGDLIARADAAKVPVPKLRIAYTHLKAYERQRAVTSNRCRPARRARATGMVMTPSPLQHPRYLKCAR